MLNYNTIILKGGGHIPSKLYQQMDIPDIHLGINVKKNVVDTSDLEAK